MTIILLAYVCYFENDIIYYFMPIKVAVIKNDLQKIASGCEDVDRLELVHCQWECKNGTYVICKKQKKLY